MIEIKNWPTDSRRTTSLFGERWGSFHDGIDIGGLEPGVQGDKLYAVADGTVVISKVNGGGVKRGYGYYIVIQHDGFTTLYGHMQALEVQVGQKVKAGQVVGHMGNTGSSTAAHLHFRLAKGNYGNNYFRKNFRGITTGSVDPLKYLEEIIEVSNMKNEEIVSDWAKDARNWVKDNHISDGTRPKDQVTREEAWTMLYRASKLNK